MMNGMGEFSPGDAPPAAVAGAAVIIGIRDRSRGGRVWYTAGPGASDIQATVDTADQGASGGRILIAYTVGPQKGP